jgi:H+/Cl- antiporter ClcA
MNNKINEHDLKVYNRIKLEKQKDTTTKLIKQFYDVPIMIFTLLFSVIIANTLTIIFFYNNVFNQTEKITFFLGDYTIYMIYGIFTSMFTMLLFVLTILAIVFYKTGVELKYDIKKTK